MDFSLGRRQVKPVREKNENCKIKIKKSSDGKSESIEFSGNCTKEQTELAKRRLSNNELTDF